MAQLAEQLPKKFRDLIPADIDLNAMAKTVHVANAKWWTDLYTGQPIERNMRELLMLMVSEVAEAMEGERKNLKDDKLPHRPMAEVELADVLIRALDFAGGFELVLGVEQDGAPLDIYASDMTENRAESLYQIACSIVDFGHEFDYQSCDSLEDIKEDEEGPIYYGSHLTSVILDCFAYCNKFGYDLLGAYEEKMSFNKVRPDHQVEARKQEHGKKF